MAVVILFVHHCNVTTTTAFGAGFGCICVSRGCRQIEGNAIQWLLRGFSNAEVRVIVSNLVFKDFVFKALVVETVGVLQCEFGCLFGC